MLVFPISARRCRSILAGLATAALLLPILGAEAQIGPPVRLAPPGTETAPSTGSPLPPPEGKVLHPLATPGITVDRLPALTADGVGALEPNEQALPSSLWDGTSSTLAESLVPKIRPSLSPTLQSLAHRLLASPAAPPVADAPGAGPPGSLLALRAERLTGLGRPDSALRLLRAAPSASSEETTRVAVDLAFLASDARGACAMIQARDHGWQAPYWDQGVVTCEALGGQADEAQLGLDLLHEAKVKDDGFSALVLRALGINAKLPDGLPAPLTMSLTLLQRAGQPLPRKVIEVAPLSVLRLVALGEGFPADQRLYAAEKAAEFGAIGPDRLAAAYLSVALDEDDRQTPLTRAKTAGGAKGRAILFQAAFKTGQMTAKANFLTSFLGDPKADLYPILVRTAANLLVEVPASEDLASVAGDFAHALYALDLPSQARAWFDLAPPEAQFALSPLAHIVAGDGAPPWAEPPAETAGAKKDAGSLRRTLAAGLLLAAEGFTVPDRIMLPLADANNASLGVPAAGPAAMLSAAVAAKRLGGTVLAVFVAVGDQNIGAQPTLAAQGVAALKQVGLGSEARHLAIDAAIAGGL